MLQMPSDKYYMDPELLVRKYEGMVISLAKRHSNTANALEDLIQEGMFGLLEANTRFDHSRGTQFGTYAHYWIRKRILAATGQEWKHQYKRVNIEDVPEPADRSNPEQQAESRLSLPMDMPEDERHILKLSYAESLSIKEISLQMNMRPERVKQLRGKALRRLRALSDVNTNP